MRVFFPNPPSASTLKIYIIYLGQQCPSSLSPSLALIQYSSTHVFRSCYPSCIHKRNLHFVFINVIKNSETFLLSLLILFVLLRSRNYIKIFYRFTLNETGCRPVKSVLLCELNILITFYTYILLCTVCNKSIYIQSGIFLNQKLVFYVGIVLVKDNFSFFIILFNRHLNSMEKNIAIIFQRHKCQTVSSRQLTYLPPDSDNIPDLIDLID